MNLFKKIFAENKSRDKKLEDEKYQVKLFEAKLFKENFFKSVYAGDIKSVVDAIEKQPEAVRWMYYRDEYVNGLSALHIAANNLNEEMVSALLERGADIDAQDYYGHTPLISVVSGKFFKPAVQIEMVKFLVANGASINKTNNHGGTALMNASSWGHMKIVRFLLKNGADPSIRDVDGETAKDSALKSGHGDIARLL